MLNEKPTVSVVIPTHNRAHLIERSIKSVLNQTFQDFEIIVVDDASRDNTEDVVNSLNIPKLKYIKHCTNKGANATRNTGIKNSIGKYIGVLDDDDEWLPQKLEKQLKLFNNNSQEVGLVYSGYEAIDGNGKVIAKFIPIKRGYIFEDLLQSNIIGSPTTLIRRECFESVGYYDEKLESCQDWDLWIRISEKYKIDYVPAILAKYNLSGNRISTNYEKIINGNLQILSKYESHFLNHKKIYSDHIKYIGVLYGFVNDFENSQKCMKLSIKKYPLNYRSVIHYIILKSLEKDYYRIIAGLNYRTRNEK